VFQTVDGNEALYCSGLPERIELARLPDELLAKPRLSVRLAAGDQARLSGLAATPPAQKP